MAPALTVIESTPRAFVGHWDDVVITVWRADIEIEEMRASAIAQTMAAKAGAARGGRFASISVVERASTRISDEARKEAARVTEKAGPQLLGVAVVLPWGGFWGALARTVASGIHFASRSRAPQRVFEEPILASEWLCERLGHGRARAAQLETSVAEARSR
jgi:hypothetical protein